MKRLTDTPLRDLIASHPALAEFLAGLGLPRPPAGLALGAWLAGLADDELLDAGIERAQIVDQLGHLLTSPPPPATARLRELTVVGGRDKSGTPEDIALILHPGDVVCVVGPTGSGKSRLLADIECLADGDTPTARRVLVDGRPAADDERHAPAHKLVAQLSQNMNFVVDLSARELIAMHARCRSVAAPEAAADEVIACANGLTGEQFAAETPVTQLSGGQTRALMIADVARLSMSPVVLIDEIENAGVDRRRALELLVSREKIVFISTHDPLLALRGGRRLVIRNGGIGEVIATTPGERRNLTRIETLDALLGDLRDRLRGGQRLDEAIAWPN